MNLNAVPAPRIFMEANNKPVSINTLAQHANGITHMHAVPDYPGAHNGLQCANQTGTATKIGAAVDASLATFQAAAAQGVDFLIVHHGLFWAPINSITGPAFAKLQTLLAANCALYSSHLPLDCHAEFGNNALLAKALVLPVTGTFGAFEGVDIGKLSEGAGITRAELKQRLSTLFKDSPAGVTAMEFGPETPARIGISSGGGTSVIPSLAAAGIDTLITGEANQHCYAIAQEQNLNVYCCGHYATETFAVQALAEKLSTQFNLPWVFLPSNCPL